MSQLLVGAGLVKVSQSMLDAASTLVMPVTSPRRALPTRPRELTQR
jgi:hypothetical protein